MTYQQETTGATKISAGKYEFNGFTIEKIWHSWHIDPTDGSPLPIRFGLGMFSTKAEAIDTIANNIDQTN